MSQIENNSIFKYITAFFVAMLIIFVSGIWLQKGSTLAITMQDTKNAAPLYAKVYYASQDHRYSEQKAAIPFKVKDNTYYFHIPKINHIRYLRLDPTSREDKHIALSSIHVERLNWFKRIQYDIPLTLFKSDVQIDTSTVQANNITFSTTGVDPQLHFEIAHLVATKSYDYHIMLLLVAMLIALILTFVFYIYMTQEHTEFLNVKIILYTLFLLFTLFKTVYYKDHVKFGYPPDESMHLAYVKYVHNNHSIVPDFTKMPHYLSHPPLYYELLSLVLDEKASNTQNIEHFRTLSMLIFLLTFILILYIGFSAKLSTLGHFVYLSVITSIPMHSYIGASINNDTLAMFAGIVFILGLQRLVERNYTTSTYLILLIGALLAYFSKLTAALLIFFAVIYFLVRMIYTREWIVLTKLHIGLIILFFTPILYYQLSIMMHYHLLVPVLNVTQPEAYLKSGFYVEEQYRQHLSPYAWFERLLHYIQGGWFGIHSHHSIGKAHLLGFIGLLVAHIIALIALFFKCPEENKSYCVIGKLTLLAILSVQIVQYIFSYKTHLHTGYLGGLQPRYLLPFMLAFAIMASLFVERFKQFFLFTILIILMCVHALYSDFFYFLQYYH
jgi:hypothetical protein